MNGFYHRKQLEHFSRKNFPWKNFPWNKKNTCRETREKYYQDLETLHEEYDVFLHDMKHTMRTIAALAREGNNEEVERLIKRLQISLGDIEEKIICSHKILNALLLERKAYANDNGVILELDISEPLCLQEIDDMDLIVLMGNLLDNAIEAEKKYEKKEGGGILCSIRLAREGRHLLIQIENSYQEQGNKRNFKKGVTERIGQKHGIGLGSVRRIVKKYGGIMECKKSGGRYLVKVILPVHGAEESAIA